MIAKNEPDSTGYYWFCGRIFPDTEDGQYIEFVTCVTTSNVYLPGVASRLYIADFVGEWYGPLLSPKSGEKSICIKKEKSSND